MLCQTEKKEEEEESLVGAALTSLLPWLLLTQRVGVYDQGVFEL